MLFMDFIFLCRINFNGLYTEALEQPEPTETSSSSSINNSNFPHQNVTMRRSHLEE